MGIAFNPTMFGGNGFQIPSQGQLGRGQSYGLGPAINNFSFVPPRGYPNIPGAPVMPGAAPTPPVAPPMAPSVPTPQVAPVPPVTPPVAPPTPPQTVPPAPTVGTGQANQTPVIPDESGGRSQVPSGASGAFSNLLNTTQTMESGKPPSDPSGNTQTDNEGSPLFDGQPPVTQQDDLYQMYIQFLKDAMGVAQGESTFESPRVTAMMPTYSGYNASTINPNAFNMGYQSVQGAQTTQADIDRFMNPYTDSVVDQTMQDIERNRLIQANESQAAAQAAGAFGGSRDALMQAEIARNALDSSARLGSQLRQQGFRDAVQFGQQDVGRRQQATLANQQADLTAAANNQRIQAMLGMGNQDAVNRARQFTSELDARMGTNNANRDLLAQQLNQAAASADSGNRLAAALAMQGIGRDMGNEYDSAMAGLSDVDAQQRAILDSLFGAAGQGFDNFATQGDAFLNALLGVLGGIPIPTTTTNRNRPGALDFLGPLLAGFS